MCGLSVSPRPLDTPRSSAPSFLTSGSVIASLPETSQLTSAYTHESPPLPRGWGEEHTLVLALVWWGGNPWPFSLDEPHTLFSSNWFGCGFYHTAS